MTNHIWHTWILWETQFLDLINNQHFSTDFRRNLLESVGNVQKWDLMKPPAGRFHAAGGYWDIMIYWIVAVLF